MNEETHKTVENKQHNIGLQEQEWDIIWAVVLAIVFIMMAIIQENLIGYNIVDFKDVKALASNKDDITKRVLQSRRKS